MNDTIDCLHQMERLAQSDNCPDTIKEELNICIERLKSEMQQFARNEETYKNQVKLLEKRCDFYTSALIALPNPTFVKNENARFVFFNSAYQKYFDICEEDYLDKTVLSLDYMPLSERKAYQKEDLELIENCSIAHHNKSFLLSDGTTGETLYWSRGFISQNFKTKGLIGEIVDISIETKLRNQLKDSVEKLEAANHQIEANIKRDYLTTLYNRRKLDDVIEKIHELNSITKEPLCVLLADLDFFKSVNDKYGHAVGDKVLIGFAQILKESCRSSDILIRYGGEEFLIVLLNTALAPSIKIAERIRKAAESKLLLPNEKNVTVSIGVTQYKQDESLDYCLIRVDKALYEAKESGRNQLCIK